MSKKKRKKHLITANLASYESPRQDFYKSASPKLTSKNTQMSNKIKIKKHIFIKKWGSLFVLGFALAIIIIDTTLLNVSLSTIIREFNTDIQSIQWVITVYSLTLAALMITGGRLGDLFGRKRMFMLGAVIFAFGSFIASVSNSVGILLLGESIIEGIGAALMMPATASLLVSNFNGKDRGIAFGVWGGIAGAAAAIGPILGGYLTNNYSWRWGFRINIFVTILLLAGSFLIKEAKDRKEKTGLDVVGIFLSSIGLISLVFGVIESSNYGWWFAKEEFLLGRYIIDIFGLSVTPVTILLGLVILLIFVLWEKKVEATGGTPLISLKLFRNRGFTSGSLTIAIVSLGQIGLIFILPVFLQAVLKLDAFQTGLALLPLSLTLLITAPLSGYLSNKISPKYIILTGLLCNIGAMFILRNSLSINSGVNSLIPGLMVYGAGMGMVMAQVSNITLSSVSPDESGEASGVSNTFRQIGSSFGSAIIGAVLLGALTTNITNGINGSRIIPETAKFQIASTLSKQSSNIEFGSGAILSTKLSHPVASEIAAIGKQAIVDSVKEALLYAGLFALFGFFMALSIPKKSHLSSSPPSSGL